MNSSVKFPQEAIPESSIIHAYLTYMSENSESPVQYHFSAILSAISVLLGRKAFFKLGAHTIFPNCYILVIGESGMTRKSSSVRPILKVLRLMNEDLILSTNLSKESLIQNFNHCGTRYLFLDEIKMLLDISNKSYAQGLITDLTHLHECPAVIKSEFKKDYDKDGGLKESSQAEFPFLSIYALTTTEWLSVTDSHIRGGFMGRFWVILSLGEKRKRIPFPEYSPEFETRIRTSLNAVLLTMGEYSFSENVKPLWSLKYTEMMEEMDNYHNDELSSFGSRLGDTLIKLCILLSASIPGYGLTIKEDVFKSASILTDYLKRTYIAMLDEVSTTDFQKNVKRTENSILRTGRIDRADLIKATKFQSDDLQKYVSHLKEIGKIFDALEDTATKKKTVYFHVNRYERIEGSERKFTVRKIITSETFLDSQP